MVLLGSNAPDFTLESSDGGQVSLQDLVGQGKKVVLYFYPRDNTPGCTIEAEGFRDAMPEFAKHNTVVFGVSKDSIASHCKFRDKFGLTFPLLSDPTGKTIEAYGAWGEKNMYGKKVEGVIRSTVIIDTNGKVEKQFMNVKVAGHVDAVLSAVGGKQIVESKAPTKNGANAKAIKVKKAPKVVAAPAAAPAKAAKKAKAPKKAAAKPAKAKAAKVAKAAPAKKAAKPAKKAGKKADPKAMKAMKAARPAKKATKVAKAAPKAMKTPKAAKAMGKVAKKGAKSAKRK